MHQLLESRRLIMAPEHDREDYLSSRVPQVMARQPQIREPSLAANATWLFDVRTSTSVKSRRIDFIVRSYPKSQRTTGKEFLRIHRGWRSSPVTLVMLRIRLKRRPIATLPPRWGGSTSPCRPRLLPAMSKTGRGLDCDVARANDIGGWRSRASVAPTTETSSSTPAWT